MSEILKTIKSELPNGVVSEAIFEGANIVLYISDKEFFKKSDEKVREIDKKEKKIKDLRADSSILAPEDVTEKTIRELVPAEAEIESIIFDFPRSIVVIEAKRPGIVIGKQGSIIKDIRDSTMWTAQTQRSPAIPITITEKNSLMKYERKFMKIGILKKWICGSGSHI